MRELGPTLADAAVRFGLKPKHQRAVPPEVQSKIIRARRFVLDASASAFMCDLSHASFSGDKAEAVFEQTRRMARAPYALTWIEYDAVAFFRRTREAYREGFHFVEHNVGLDGNIVVSRNYEPDPNVCPTIGMLIEQERETQFSLTIVAPQQVRDDAMIPITMPCKYVWTTDDSRPTQRSLIEHPGHLAIGMPGVDEHISMVAQRGTHWNNPNASLQMMAEFAGELRYALALLAAINDVPIGIKHVEASKGYMARGRYRKYLDHSVISIVLPKGRDPRKVAMQVVEHSRRRAHQVRGHWREDFRFPLSSQCTHDFHDDAEDASHQVCKHCHGRKIWITEHQRGDASLGFVQHSYRVKTEESSQ
jgi:hypothetical protein